MQFYTSISTYYDFIFPLHPPQVNLITSHLVPPFTDRSVLEVGCATGNLTIALAQEGLHTYGIDSDKEMILRAEEKAAELPHTSRPQFQQLDMRQLHTAFSPEAMDGVICLGNTLVHLTETTEIETVISHMQRIIKRNGFCFIQIIHYDYILDSGIEELPTIENEHIRFERQYHYDQDHHLITFMTQLTAKEQREVLENSVLLYPLRKHELQDMLEKTGYINIRFFGDFTGSPLAETSLALIAVAQIP